jgi:hypothetical protein
MALALRFEMLLRTGAVGNDAELARLGHVSCARERRTFPFAV